MKRNRKWVLWIVLGAAALTALILLLLLPKRKDPSWQPATEPSSHFSRASDTTAPVGTGPEEAEASGIQYPFALDNGKITITSLFQYSGINPDADYAEGTNIGAIAVTNSSEDYLESLTVTATMSDGSVLRFELSDLPAGQTLWAFAQENGSFDGQSVCTKIESQSAFTQNSGDLGTDVSYEVQGVEVTLTNETSSEFSAGELRCHIVLNGIYFGGTSYAYPVGAISPGDSVTVTAADCILGEAAPVRLRQGD